MVLGADTVNPYLAIRAVLLLVRHGTFATGTFAAELIAEHVRTVAFPGMGTGVGWVPPDICARQTRAALDEHMAGRFRLPTSWAEASEHHQLLYTDRPKRLQ
jgi:O-acetyl-ADP-ribose deacetylase (regulator of RNase III)